MLDYVEYLADVLTFEELEVQVKAVEMLMKDGTVATLEECLHRIKEEKRDEEREAI